MAGRLHIDWPTLAGALLFLVIGGGFAGFGGWQLWTTAQFMKNAETVEAIVVDAHESCDDDGCTWWPEFARDGPDGQPIQQRTQFGSSAYGMSEGSRQTVLVNPDFAYVRMPGTDNLWLLGGAFFGFGALGLTVAIWLLLRQVFRRET